VNPECVRASWKSSWVAAASRRPAAVGSSVEARVLVLVMAGQILSQALI
jgi:hypothetical protein